jgi:UDP-glucose 4-epimerase
VFAVTRKHVSASAKNPQWIQRDLADTDSVQALFKEIRPDIIFHLTSHGVGTPGMELVLPTFRDDLLTTVNVLTAAGEIGCGRIILAASLEEPNLDNGEITPSSPYACAKWAGSAYARMFHKLYAMPVVITRPFMTYGPGQRPHKLIPYTTLSLLRGESPRLSSGQRLVDWIYIDDVVDGFLAAAQACSVEGCTIDLGSGTLVSIRDVIVQLVELVGSEVQPLFGALGDRRMEQVRVADTAAAWTKLHWKPMIPLQKGLELTVDWFRLQLQESHF